MAGFSNAADTDPSLVAAACWIRDLLTGSVGMSVAVLAIAWIGFAMLQGRVDVREGARIILGCFILFGAPIIAAAFVRMARPEQTELFVASTKSAAPPIAVPAHPPQFDPYAGASVPNH